MRSRKKFRYTVFLLLAILLPVMTASAVTADTGQNRTEKEEVVYANLDSNGSLEDTYVVNILKPQKDTALDYGDYTEVRNMTSSDKIEKEGDKITIKTQEEELYYEGTVEKAQLPWDISIRYFLDGKEISPDNLAGKKGSLKISGEIKENKKANPHFFKNYAVQTGITLDTKLCENINAEGATIANVGSDKQFTYTALPGKGCEFEITTKVENFQMEAISINGIKLALDPDISTEELEDKMRQLSQGISSVNKGAGQLNRALKNLEGTGSLEEALKALSENGGKLTSGSSQIEKGLQNLTDGSKQLKAAVNYNAYKKIMKENGLDIDVLQKNNKDTIEALNNQIGSLKETVENLQQILDNLPPDTPEEQIQELERQIKEIEAQISQLEGIDQLLYANQGAITGTQSYLNGANSSIGNLVEGCIALNTNYKELGKGLGDYVDGVNFLAGKMSGLGDGVIMLINGSSALAAGTQTLENETKAAGEDMKNQIDDMLKELAGDGVVKSFVSDKNTNVDSVEFVIQTKDIKEVKEEADEEEEEPKTTFWQKLKNLF